jgi:hypothetical protein
VFVISERVSFENNATNCMIGGSVVQGVKVNDVLCFDVASVSSAEEEVGRDGWEIRKPT